MAQVHILNESRGSTLEVCVSRMKLRGTSVRFVLLSATAPNICDIAAWIGLGEYNNDKPAETFAVHERKCLRAMLTLCSLEKSIDRAS